MLFVLAPIRVLLHINYWNPPKGIIIYIAGGVLQEVILLSLVQLVSMLQALNNLWSRLLYSQLKSKRLFNKGMEYYESINKHKKNTKISISLVEVIFIPILAVSEDIQSMPCMHKCDIFNLLRRLRKCVIQKTKKTKLIKIYFLTNIEAKRLSHNEWHAVFSCKILTRDTQKSLTGSKGGRHALSWWQKYHHLREKEKEENVCDACGWYPSHTAIHKGFCCSTAGIIKKWPDLIYISLSTHLSLSLSNYIIHAGLLSHISLTLQSLSQKVNNQRTLKH